MERLAPVYYRQAAVNGRLHIELRKILAECARAGIRVLVLKGAAIAEPVYGNIAVCPMQDLDLLVGSEDLDATDRLLRAMRYLPNESSGPASWYRDHHHHLPPYVGPDGAVVEVHHHILPPSAPVRIPIEDLWRRARPAGSGVDAVVLCPEDLLLHLCLHVSLPYQHHFCLGLRWICDIAGTIRCYGDEIDWMQVRQRACEWGARKYVYLTLRLARELVDAEVPDEALDSLRPEGFDPQVIVWAKTQIFADGRENPPLSPNLARMWGSKRLWEKATLLLKRAVPSPKVMARMYPVPPDSKWIYLYYPVLWRDLLWRNGRSAWGLLRHDDAMVGLAEQENQKTALREWLVRAQ
jgi:hypothetical protein